MTHDEYLQNLKAKRTEFRTFVEHGLRSAIEAGLELSMPQGVPYVHEDEDCTFVISDVKCAVDGLFVSGHIAGGDADISDVPIATIDSDSLLQLYEGFLSESPPGVFVASTLADLVRQLTGVDREFFLRHVSGNTGFTGTIGPLN